MQGASKQSHNRSIQDTNGSLSPFFATSAHRSLAKAARHPVTAPKIRDNSCDSRKTQALSQTQSK